MSGTVGRPGRRWRRPPDATRVPPLSHGGRRSSARCSRLHLAADAVSPGRGDNEQVSEDTRRMAPARLGQALRQGLAFVRSAEPRAAPPRRAIRTDSVIAAGVLAASLIVAWHTGGSIEFKHGLAPAVIISVPLAARRWYPLT